MRTNSRKLSLAWRLTASLVVWLTVFSPATQASAHNGAVVIEGVPSLKQKYSLSCEYAAAAAVTLFWGEEVVSQDHFIREVPNHPNPHRGFRGDINGPHGGTSDYGIYAEPLVPVLESHGYDATVFYGGASRLRAEIDEGHPIVVWITSGKDSTREGFYETYRGERFKLVPYEHTVVVYGYDAGGVYVMDVGTGGKYYTEWESFLRRWSYFDQMALLIHPK
jgi:uncharacterized protein YvpB